MPQVSADVHVPVPPELAFAVSQTHGAIRRGWDPFIREQHFLDGAQHPATGVRTFTRSAFLGPISPTMVSEYVSWRPPTSVGMTMVSGPPFFSRFGGGWRFTPDGDGTRAVWKYTYDVVGPPWFRRIGVTTGQWLLGREIRKRIDAFAAACRDEQVVLVARADLEARAALEAQESAKGEPRA